jgi:serine/threonine protein kinase
MSDMDKLNSMPSRENYDAHVVPVLPKNPLDPDEAVYYPAEAGAAALTTYMELVVFDSSQALPRYIVDVAPSSIPRPRISIPHPTPISGVISREVPLRYGMLFAGRDTDGPELLQVLTSLRNVDALKKHIETGEKERKDRQRRIKSQKIDASAEKLMKSSSDVAVGEQIGEGSSGVVHRAEAHYMGDVRVAVKRLKSNTPQLEAALKKEALVMMRVSSPFVVRVYGMLSAPLGIIMELVEQGSLHDHLQRRPFTVDEQFNLCRGMTCGLKSLHDAGILHCDLKGKNILLDDSFDSHKSFMPKITDFGIARVCAQSDTLAGGTLLSPGTVEWMAPELWREKPEFSAASDTYALGMVFYEILTRRNPWAAEMAELEKGQTPLARVPGWVLDGRRPKFEDVKDVDTVLAEIMVSCWKQQPSDRPSLAGILDKLRAESPSARAARAAEAERQRKIREAEERKVAEAKVRCITQCCRRMPSFLPSLPLYPFFNLSLFPSVKDFFQATEAERQRKIREAEERKVNTNVCAAICRFSLQQNLQHFQD